MLHFVRTRGPLGSPRNGRAGIGPSPAWVIRGSFDGRLAVAAAKASLTSRLISNRVSVSKMRMLPTSRLVTLPTRGCSLRHPFAGILPRA